MLMLSFAGFACDRPSHAASDLPAPNVDLERPEAGSETRHAVLAAGCFWCVEAVFEQLEGVSEVVSGYAGGSAETATYEAVSSGGTDHAEVVRITYDPATITFGQLLRVFFATHDPTTLNRQGADRGTQYRSAIFYQNDEEERQAREAVREMQPYYPDPIVTEISPLRDFYEAEAEHQDFYRQNSEYGYCRVVIDPKLQKLRQQFAHMLKGATPKN
mgnify:CR=1 FL=1